MFIKGLIIIIATCVLTGSSFAQITTNSHTFTWTAPGDDGSTGTATTYELRYTMTDSTVLNWSAATLIPGLPSPKIAGSAESFTVNNLPFGTLFFAIKACDEKPNCAVRSNVVKLTFIPPDTTAPAMIDNLK